jgi:subtilisin-like proprotein convertase family protein
MTSWPKKNFSAIKKSRKYRDLLRREARKLHLESLEDRRVMAIGPTLSALFADGSVVPINSVLNEAPRELRLRFADDQGLDPNTLATGIGIVRSGFDNLFGQANDVSIIPGSMQLADSPREVIIRFQENLPDDLYRIQLIGSGPSPLRNEIGDPFNDGVNVNFGFELDLGPQAISVVPQPITRNPVTGALSQAKNQIHVYFNNDKLDFTAATNPAFYRLTDSATGGLILPQAAQYLPAENKVILIFASDLTDSSFHLQIGVSDELNDTLGTAVNVGTIVQRAEYKVYDSPVLLDQFGNPVSVPIPDNDNVISRITVGDAFLVRDVNVEVNIDHEWGPDLRVFLIGPQGDRVELIRDLGVGLRQGQIYGTKFDDQDGDGVQDAGEPGLAGWTIFLDDNRNAVLDAWERSTVSDANGDYAFIGLELGQTYFVAEVGQPLWRQTTPTAGGERDLFLADFSNGAQQTVRIIPDPVNGNPTTGTFVLGFGLRTTAPITYAGANATTAANIQQALQAIVDPTIAVTAQFIGTGPIRFQLNFARNGLGTPADHPPIAIVTNALDRGSLAVDTVGLADGFTSTGTANQWHLSSGRGGDPGHTGQQSFYFGANETPTGGGLYQNNANGTLISPTVDLRDQRITGPLFLEFNHFLATESGFDFARVEVVNAAGQRTTILNTDSSTSGFEAVTLDISQFAGQEIHFEFTFVSDGSVVFEGWYVDDIRVTEQRGIHSVTLSALPQSGSAKDVDFGVTLGNVLGPDQFGYRAFEVTPNFEDITTTGQRTLQEFVSAGFAKQAGGTGSDQANSIARDASGNVYVTGSFQGTAVFGPFTRNSAGVGDIFLAKYDPSGLVQWVNTIGGVGNDTGNDVQVDSAGNVLITGSFNNSVDFGGGALTSAGSTDAFVAKYDSSGNFIWAKQLGGLGADVGEGLAIAAGNNPVVTGSFSGTADMNPDSVAVNNLTSAGGTDIFVTRLTSAGNFSWTRGYGSTGTDIGRAVAIDAAGNVNVTGSFSGTVDFDPAPDPTGPALISAGSSDGFVLQLTSTGAFRWNERFGGSQADFGAGIAVDSAGDVVVAGGQNNDAYLAKHTGLTGAPQWTRSFGGSATDAAEDVAIDAQDRIYLTGGYRGTFSLGGTTFTTAGGQDIFVARYTPVGGFDLLRSMGGTQDDTGLGIVPDTNSDAYYVGSFRTTSTFDTGPSTATLTSAGSTDAFLAKLAVVRGLDDATVHLTDADLGNFLFQFYGQNYQELFVSTNGLITFGSANDSPDNTNLQDPPPQATIAPFWEDLITGAGNTEAVFWEVRGAGADERLIIQWNNVRLAGTLGLGQSPLNFQAVLNERDNSIQFNYQVVTGPILVQDLADTTIGTFVKGQQNQPSMASDAAGNYVIVWTTGGQDGSGNAIYGRRYNAAGVPLGVEFQINSVSAGDQTLAQIAMAADGRFIVVWQTDNTDVMARLFDPSGVPVGNDFQIHVSNAGTQADPAVYMDNTGAFVVAWRGEGTGDNDGIYARRFDSAGTPLGTVNEIQRLQILGPPPGPLPDTFTLVFAGTPTAAIGYAGVNNSGITATNIQTRLRALPNLSDSVTVTAVQQNEVQTLTFNPSPTGGTFTLVLGAQTTANIDFTANLTAAARATDIQNKLNALLNTNVSVVGLSPNSFAVTFQGISGNQNQPALAIGTNAIAPAGVTLNNVETVRGINLTEQYFDVSFLGPDGGIDQPLLQHGDRLSGVTHINFVERIKGNNGEILVNSFLPGLQTVPTIAGNAAGGFLINWTSDGQDGSLNGVFAKRFDANGVALPGDADEIQQIELVGPPAAGSRYQLDFDGQVTANIFHTGRNITDANSIQNALRNLPNLGNTLTVRPAVGVSNEVQLLRFSAVSTGGNFRLAHSGLTTADIAFTGTTPAASATNATNIQNALNALPNLVSGVTVVPVPVPAGDPVLEYLVTFGGPNANIDQPLMFLENNALTPFGSVTIVEENQGGRSTNRFLVEFNGVDGRTDQPNLLLADNTGGVIAMNTVEIQKGANSEFVVPDNTFGDQLQPVLASQPINNGNYLSVWTSPDGDASGVWAKLFAADGSPLGAEFQVNTFTQASQVQPQAVVDAAGNFVIVWTSDVQDGSVNGIFARLFTSDGIALGDEFQVNVESIANQTEPTIALTPTGFVVAWTSQAGAGGIHSRQFTVAGGIATGGPELQVSTFGTPSQTQPVVARNAAGDYVVVWVETQKDPLVDPGIYYQKFFGDGVTPPTAELRANVTTIGSQQLPDVAIDAAGNFTIVWQTFVDEVAPLADHFDVVARRFDANGNALTGEIPLSTIVANAQTAARVALTPGGGFVATWQSFDQDGDGFGVYARRFDSANNPLGAEFRVNTTTVNWQRRPAIDATATGEFIIVWDGEGPDFSTDIWAQRYDAAGQPIGAEFRINATPATGGFNKDQADVAFDGAGRFVVAWQDWSSEIIVRQFDAAGLPLTGDVVVSQAGSSSGPRISTTPDGRSTVVWQENTNIIAQRLTPDLELIGNNLVVNNFVNGNQTGGTVSMGPDGEFLVGWLDQGQGGARVIVNQYSTENPSVGIKDAGTQTPFTNLLPIWTNGANTPFVGDGLSTWIVKPQPERQRVFAVDSTAGMIRELNPDTGAVIRSIPAPGGAATGAGLAFVGNTLYYAASSGSAIFELDPSDGAVVDQMSLASLGIVGQVGGLAYLNGRLVAQVPTTGTLYFIDTFNDTQVRSVATGLPFLGGLAGGGDRGSLFGLNASGQIVEIDAVTETVVNMISSGLAQPTGLAVIEGNLWVGNAAGTVRVLDADNGALLNSFATAIPLSALGGDNNGGIETADTSIFQPMIGTILDDEATTPINAGVAPYTGRYIPVEPLSAYDANSVNGLWTLEVQDTATNHVGVLDSWKLIINQPDQTPADFQTRAYLGDNMAKGANDIDLYRFNVLEAGALTIDLNTSATLDGVVRAFNAAGTQIGLANVLGAGADEHLVVNLPAAGTYYIGISSNANVAYNPVTGANATGGTTRGEYVLEARFEKPVFTSDDNSIYAEATNFGQLGEGGHFTWSEIRGGGSILNMPGSGDEPGHRDIPIEAHLGSASGSLSYVPDQLLLQFKSTATALERAALLAANGLEVVKTLGGGTLLLNSLVGDVLQKVRTLSSELLVKFAEPNYIVQKFAVPNDPSFSQLWGMNNIGQVGGNIDADIDAIEAWDVTTGSDQVVIAVIDTGVDYNHPDLVENMWRNPGEIVGDLLDNDGNGFVDDIYGIDTAYDDTNPFDGDGHGTHVSGTIAAVGDNGVGVVGVSWRAKVMALKFLDDFGFGSTSDAVDALDYLTMMKNTYGVNVVASNNSWGGGGFSQALQDAIQRSNDAGVLFVAAAGNGGDDNDVALSYPASYPLDGIISVAASDPVDKLVEPGSFGGVFNSSYGATTVDLAAPGVQILSTTPGNTYSVFQGTSMATPHVTGAVAVLAGANPSASIAAVKAAILAGVDPSPALNGKVLTGGRLNLANSLDLIGVGTGGGSAVGTFLYNFQDFYGVLPSGDIPQNVITENQKQRTREIFEIYGSLIGMQFIESATQGLTVVTGDPRTVDPTVPTGPGGVAGIAGGGVVVMDAAENWGNSEYGGGWFRVAMHEIGHALGLGHTYDLPSLTIMGDQNSVDAGRFPDVGEPVFPGDADIVHAQLLHPQGANDMDLYRFELTEPGVVRAEVLAEREDRNSLLDANLTLYREWVTLQGVTQREVIAGNDDYFSSDPRIEVKLEPGVYYVGVTSSGNREFDPALEDSGFGGRTEGTYELYLDFQGAPGSSLNDITQKPLDGDADGKLGGQFDFWFESGETIFVDKVRDVTPGTDGNGTIATPYDNIAAALADAGKRIVIPSAGGAAFADGETFVLVDNLDTVVTFELDSDGTTALGAIPVPFATGNSQATMASAIAAAINGATGLTASATVSGGKIVKLAGIVRLDVAGSETLMSTPNIVRIVGNGGTDGNANTLLDNRPYLVGFNNVGQSLADGRTFDVPQATTVMIDAGALFKVQGANIDVGSSAQGIDRSAGALQVLGTPQIAVSFRSFRDDTAGGNSDGVSDGVHPGDWGGLVLRDDSDREQEGMFLNWINHANMEAGGGKVLVGSVEETFTPIHMVSSRPGISHNTIRLSADAAISADPNSFDDSLGRIGPDIHDNLVTNNTTNGLFVRIRTQLGSPVDRLTLPGRFDDTDIVHVLSENLFISSTPGGPLLDELTGDLVPRIDARLQIDPGIILKIDGARIETQLGGQLIAEGTAAHPIIFTSIKDDTYGGSGTFDTSNDGATAPPTAGQWGGLFFGPFAKGSVDHALFTFAGGSTPIEGGFDQFSVMEIHQADVRVTNSTFEVNADGKSTTNRSGRGDNDGSVVFVRGAQPVIVRNVFKDNEGAAISVNANAMQALYRPDPGRTTGLSQRFTQFDTNQGPLVRLNRLGNNSTNGMIVRGADLTTETVWDDTDIVHVVLDEIEVLNHHTFSGLRLISSVGESLVVKLDGTDAGLTASGVPLDIDDRIGGTIQVMGQPDHPVVLTSLQDCSIGAGFTPEGQPQLDTDNSGACDVQQPIGNSGAVIVDGGDRDDFGHGSATAGPDGIIGTPDDINLDGWRFIEQMVAFTYAGARNGAPNDVLVLGARASGGFGTGALEAITSVTTVLGLNMTVALDTQINTVNFSDYKVIYVPSNEFNTFGGITQNELDLLALRKAEIAQFINSGGSLVALTDAESPRPYAWLELPLPFTITDFSAGGIAFPLRKTPAAIASGFTITDAELSFGVPYHNDFTGPPGFNGLVPFVLDTGDDGIVGNADDRVITLGLGSGSFGIGNPPSNWRSVLLDTYANDRNVELVLESELGTIGPVDVNATPATAQFLGVLAPNEKSGDADRRLGFEIEGRIALDDASDLDVYSFVGSTGSEVWIDIDRTSAGLDTIVELVDANGTVLAQSLDNDTLSGLAQTIIKETYLGGDYFSINPRDAGMRVVLPGVAGQTATYYVRVRSQPVKDQEANLEGGTSRGHYQLQVRLKQRDEVAGSTVKNSDIFYATNGIEIRGQNGHSPLVGETGEFGNNGSLGTANEIGNLLQSDRNTISVAGDLSALDGTDVDWFTFTIDYDLIQAIGGFNGADKTWATMFDIDYADGISRPDAVLSVWDDAGNLVLVSRDSNIEDDQPGIGEGADTDDLTRGTFGTLDPYIGTVQMPAGVVPATPPSSRRYYVSVSSNALLPSVLNATFVGGANNPLIRMEPVNSVIRIAEDHIGFSGHTTGTAGGNTSFVQPVQSLFDISSSVALDISAPALDLSDLTLYVSQGGNQIRLSAVNPETGELLYDIGQLGSPPGNQAHEFGDIAMRSDGRLFGVQDLAALANTEGRLVEIDWTNAGETVIGNDAIPDFNPGTNPPDPNQRTGDEIDALAYLRTGFDQANNTPTYELYYSVFGSRAAGPQSVLYRANPATGQSAVANTPFQVQGVIGAGLGRTRGLAFSGGQLFGVTDAGAFYSVGGGFSVNLGIQFAGLAPAPQNLQNGAFADFLFAIDTSGTLYCLDTSGNLQGVFDGGATSIDTGLGSATGLAFSPLDFNLWHPTETRRLDAGHGINPSFDESRNNNNQFPVDLNGRGSNEQVGGASFYFGLDNWAQNPDTARAYFPYNGVNAQHGVLSSEAHRDLASTTGGTYNATGGALGTLQTSQFSLDGYNLADKPTLYFNYFLNTQGRNSRSDTMRDSFRVHISRNGGLSWEPLVTNNSELSSATVDMELPRFISPSWNASDHELQRVQEAFDNTGGWRQARVDLSEFAGDANLQIRFDFSTAGSMNRFLPGDDFGNFFDRERTLANDFEGVFIDDVILGFSERGEMVTASSGQTSYFPIPENPDPDAPSQVLAGAYQLEIRRGTEYGANTGGVISDIVIGRQFDTNDRLIAPLLRLGDQNVHREQGHIVIESNTIRLASEFGIVVDAGARDAVPHPGTVRNLTTLNNRDLAPGVSLENNVIAALGTGGILFSGDPNTSGAPAAVYYGRILNNTVHGGTTPRGTGIVVSENANPTILNNIVANTSVGISVDASSSATVVGTTIFMDNGSNGVVGSNAIQLPTGSPLFVSPATGNYYLMPGSQAIDSSLNTLAEDLALLAVKSPLGIPTAPIIAPERDRYNQLRVDDPLQQPPPGLGANVFKDRGAIERSDFVRPGAFILDPLDNDLNGRDRNAALNAVSIKNEDLFVFILQLTDTGTGIDDANVKSSQFVLTMDGVQLVEGIDYDFAYDANTNAVIFLPLAGIWTRNKTYLIDVDNSVATGVKDLGGNRIEANQTDGTTQFTIFFGVIRDFGDAPDPTYPTLNASNGASHEVVAGYHLGAGVSEENEGQPTASASGDTFDDGLTSHSLTPGGTPSHLTVVASGDGKLDAWLDLNRDGDWSDTGEYIVSSATPAGQLVAGSNNIPLTLPAGGRGTSYLRLRFSSAGITSPIGVATDGEVEDYQVQLLGPPFQNPNLNRDVNNDGKISPNDALLIVNQLNRAVLVLGSPGFDVPNATLGILAAPPYYDVNGDNRVTISDAALVISYLNFLAGPQPEGEAGTSDMAATVYASSSVVIEAKSSSATTSSTRSQLDDQLFAEDSVAEMAVSAPIAAYHPQIEDDLESPKSGDAWDQALEEFSSEITID